MAEIYIKRKLKPYIFPDERARELKKSWLDTENVPRDTPVDLGIWAGEIGEIKAIEIEPKREEKPEVDYNAVEQEERRKFASQPAEAKAKSLANFSLFWSRYHDWQKPPEEVLAEAEKIQLWYYNDHPNAWFVPNELFKGLVADGKRAQPLAEKMTAPVEEIKKDLSTN